MKTKFAFPLLTAILVYITVPQILPKTMPVELCRTVYVEYLLAISIN